MPRRYLNETITLSTTIDRLIPIEETFYMRLITVADDFGRFDARPEVLKAKCFPLKPHVTPEQCVAWAVSMALKAAIYLYENDGKLFGFFPAWLDHQYCRSKESRFPAPSDANTLNRERLVELARMCAQTRADALTRAQMSADARNGAQPRTQGEVTDDGDKALKEKEGDKNLRADARNRAQTRAFGTNTYTYTNTFTDYLSVVSSTDKARADFIFGPGLDLLISQGASESGARKHLGAMLSRYGSATAACAVWQALQDGAGDARSYMVGVAKRIKAETDQHGGFTERDYKRDATPEAEIGWLSHGKA